MESCDVLIVGGGPAGSSCAWQLRRRGLDVVVLDRSEFPRDKVCAGWITPQIVESLHLDLEEYRKTRVLQPLEGFTTGLVGGRPSVVSYGDTISYAIRRCEFDEYLLRRSGARLRLGEPLESAVRRDDAWWINESVRARVLVGAGGHFCPVARLLGADVGHGERAICAQEIEFRMSAAESAQCPVEPHQGELYFCDDLEGYGWCVRKGDYLNVGLGRTDNHGLKEAVHAFWDWLAGMGRIPRGMTPRFKGHAYLLYDDARRTLLGDHAVLIGDAAGLAYDRSGEGIRPAVESGLIAAQVIEQLLGGEARALDGYVARLEARFGRRPATQAPLRAASGPIRRRLGRLLVANRQFARHVILDRNFLHRQSLALHV
jgi:geranylgeranyl reductase family protein